MRSDACFWNLSVHSRQLFNVFFVLFLYYLTIKFSSSAQALCLSDEPRAITEYQYPEKLPGELYDADTQCKWQFGEKAKLCTLDFKKVKNYSKCMPSIVIECKCLKWVYNTSQGALSAHPLDDTFLTITCRYLGKKLRI